MLLLKFIIALVLVLILDGLYLGAAGTAKNQYLPAIERIQGVPVSLDYISAGIAYLILAFGLVYFVFLKTENELKISSIRSETVFNGDSASGSAIGKIISNGVAFGIFGYGLYNFTNSALLDNHSVTLGIQDTIWGATLGTVSGLIYFFLLGMI